MTNKNQSFSCFLTKATFIPILFILLLCSQRAFSQTVDLTSPDTYPSSFPLGTSAVATNYSLSTKESGKIKLNVAYCGYDEKTDGFLQMYKDESAKKNKRQGVINYVTASKISSVSVKTNSSQSNSGAIEVLVDNTSIGSESSLIGGKVYTFAIDKSYQVAGNTITIKSTGTANVRLDQIVFDTAPIFSPEGGNYYSGQTVEMSAVEGSTIYYTTDGSTPTTSSNKYESTITLPVGTTTISAIAVDSDGDESAVTTATYVVTEQKATPTFYFSGDESSFTVEYSNASSFEPPTLKNGSDVDEVYSSSNTAVATVDESTGALTINGYGTTVITASVDESTQYKAASASYTLTVTDYTETYELLTDASTLAAGDVLLIANGTSGDVYLARQWTTDRPNVYATKYTIESDGFIVSPASNVARLVVGGEKDAWTLKDRSYYWMATGTKSNENNSNELTGSTTLKDCGYATISIASDSHAAKIVFDDAYSNTIYYYQGSGDPVFSCYHTTTNDPVYLFRKVERVKIGSHGMSSFSSSNNLRFAPTDVQPYTATAVSEGLVTLTPFNKVVPQQTGVMLKGTAGTTFSIPVAYTASSEVGDNYLHPILKGETIATSADCVYHYLFGTMNGETAFFKLETAFTSNANRCYLETSDDIQPKDNESKGLTLNFIDEETNAIKKVSPVEQSKAIYTLSGQRVREMSRPGIYIVGGRKVVRK